MNYKELCSYWEKIIIIILNISLLLDMAILAVTVRITRRGIAATESGT